MIFDRVKAEYYRAPVDAVPEAIRAAARPRRSSIPPWAAWSTAGLVLVLLVLNAVLLRASVQPLDAASGVISAGYLLVSIVLHEAAHVVALLQFGRSIDRVGFKLNHRVFPAFYVRMNQSLLLSRGEQVVVHASGALVNLSLNLAVILLNGVTIQSSALSVATSVVFIAIGWNVLPILNSDGYRVLLALTATDAARRLIANPPWLIAVKVLGVASTVLVVLRTAFDLTRSLLD